MQGMTEREKFLFDLNGYIVVPGVLTSEEVAALNAAVDANAAGIHDYNVGEMPPAVRGSRDMQILAGLLTFDEPHCNPFSRLIAHPKIRPYLNTMLGQGWHLDQEPFVFLAEEGAAGLVFHGSTRVHPYGGFQYDYNNGVMQCGMVVLEFHLNEQVEDQGGFACVPGSHKANVGVPASVVNYETDRDQFVNPGAKAGDLIIFSEATLHGTLPWRAKSQRRVALYRYCPAYLQNGGFASSLKAPEWVNELEEAEKVAVEPPYITKRPYIADDGTVVRP